MKAFLGEFGSCCSRFNSSNLKFFAGVRLFCLWSAARRYFLWEKREWPIGLCDQCPRLREKETKRLAKRKEGNPPDIHCTGVCRVLEEMGFLKLTSRNSKNIVSWARSPKGFPSVTLLLMVLVLEIFLSVLADAGVLVLLKSITPALWLYDAYRCIVATINNSTVWVKRNRAHRR
jgi:hypothetical protein